MAILDHLPSLFVRHRSLVRRSHAALVVLARLLPDTRGVTAVVIALSLSGIVGFAGLGTEVAGWYMTKRQMQGAADAAAATAATALSAGATADQITSSARSITATMGFTNGSKGAIVSVNNPPLSGSYKTSTAVEVIISQRETPLLSGLFLSSGPTIKVRSVATANTSRAGQGCVVAFDNNSSDYGVFVNSSNAAMTFNSCSLYVNSPSPATASNPAVDIAAGGTISALSAFVVGGVGGTGLTTTNGTYTGVDPITDPYASVSVPNFSGCDKNNYKLAGNKNDSLTVNANGYFVFCSGLTVQGGSTLTLGAGTFIIDQGTLDVQGGGVITATSGTTIILTTSNSSNGCSNINFEANSTVTLTAPTSGSLSGLAIFMDRACTDKTQTNTMGGAAYQTVTGAIYLPNEDISYQGGAATGGAVCTQLLAWQIIFSGSSTFNSTCSGAGTQSITLAGGSVVE